MDEQEKTRMLDTYVKINKIVDDITNLGVFPSLVWVWAWDVVTSLYDDYLPESLEDWVVNPDFNKDNVWEMFWTDADKNGFTLEYGVESLDDSIRDWMFEREILIENVGVDED